MVFGAYLIFVIGTMISINGHVFYVFVIRARFNFCTTLQHNYIFIVPLIASSEARGNMFLLSTAHKYGYHLDAHYYFVLIL